MPCILKQRTKDSPGIVTFTNNEAIHGPPRNSRKVKDFLLRSSRAGEWVYGVHIQGNCGYVKRWPIEEWESFFLWTQPDDSYLNSVPAEKKISLNCINFMPELHPPVPARKIYDICILSRPCPGKRIYPTLQILRELMNLKPDLKVTIMAPDPRDIRFGEKTYEAQKIDRRFFDVPLDWFSSNELKNMNFICSSTTAFGRFPLASELMYDQVSKSKFTLSNSHYEGVPRAYAEAHMLGIPCIVSKNLSCGMSAGLNPKNTLFTDDDPKTAAKQILDALEHYDRFQVDDEKARQDYAETYHFEPLKKALSGVLGRAGRPVAGTWYLDELANRLPCHGKRHNYQFLNNPDLFLNWIEKVQQVDPLDEDAVLGKAPLDDTFKFSPLDSYDRVMEKVEKIKKLSPDKIQRKLKQILDRKLS